MQSHQVLYNTLAALIQIAIGLGILYRPTVKQALLVSFVWAFAVWWFGEAFGMLFMNMANPLTGAPGAVLLYAFIGAIVWPNERPGGLLGVTGARIIWANLWILMGVLWLLAVNSSANATTTLLKAAPAGPAWLATLQNDSRNAAEGDGLTVALLLAALSIVIGLAVALNWQPKTFLGSLSPLTSSTGSSAKASAAFSPAARPTQCRTAVHPALGRPLLPDAGEGTPSPGGGGAHAGGPAAVEGASRSSEVIN